MFDRKLFTYNEETHTGFYNGEVVPSCTQLINVLYPLDERIPEENLKKAHINKRFVNEDADQTVEEIVRYIESL